MPPSSSRRPDRVADPARNLALIPVHQVLSSAYVWIPVFVLFTRSRFGLGGALTLASLYYLSVVLLEVPSGWMSDRFGRVITLRVAAASWIIAQTCLLVGDDSFPVILAGQFFLAGGFASLSGTDVTFHYDTLEALDRATEYPRRQARISALGFVATALSALVGGVVGYIELRAAFAVALVLAVVQFAVTLALVEPGADAASVVRPRAPAGDEVGEVAGNEVGDEVGAALRSEGFGAQLASCARYLRTPYLGWLFGYGVVLVTLEHAAFSVLQPWLTELADGTATDVGATPLLVGVVSAVVALVGSVAARASEPVARRFGTVATLLGLGVLSAIVVSAMAIWVAPAVLALIALRNAQGAAAPVLISDAVAARVERRHRATLLSLDSLAGRLGWGLILLVLGRAIDDDVGRTLTILAGIAWILVVAITLWAVRVGRWDTRPGSDPERVSSVAPS